MASTRNSFVDMLPYTNVDCIKIATSVEEDIETAIINKGYMELDTILNTRFGKKTIDAFYFVSGLTENQLIFTIYRKTPAQNYYQYVCTLSGGAYSISDYNIESNNFYHYLISVESIHTDSEGNTSSTYYTYENTDAYGNTAYFHTGFDQWTICSIEENDNWGSDKLYTKVGRTWNLGLNFQGLTITLNLAVASLDTLGKYPKVTRGIKNYDSMRFSSFLGNIQEYNKYTYEVGEDVTASEGTISSVNEYTEKLETYNSTKETWTVTDPFAREVDKLNAWKEFISDGNLKLLRDTKGNSWIVEIVNAGEHTVDNASNIRYTAISFDWIEVASAQDSSVLVFAATEE